MRINDLPVPRISRNCLGLDWRLLGQKPADAAGHDDAIGMFVHDELSLRFVFE